MNNYKLVAPDIDSLLNCFEWGFLNPAAPSEDLCKALDPLFEILRNLAPLRKNNEAKAIWITIPRGAIEDFGSYEDMLEWDMNEEETGIDAETVDDNVEETEKTAEEK